LTGLYQKLMAMNHDTAELLLVGAVQVADDIPGTAKSWRSGAATTIEDQY
jgi:hypothetical protein